MEVFESWLAGILAQEPAFQRPLVTLSYAQSLDGSLSSRRGEPTQLSGPEASGLTHRLRAAHQAILVGVGTVLADNPRLTVRLAPGENPQPVILDSHLRTPSDAFVLVSHPKPAWIATTEGFDPEQRRLLEAAGARVLLLPADDSGWVDLPALLEYLDKMGIRSLMVEGGARVISSFLAGGLVDQVVLTIAPVFLGGLRAVEGNIAEVRRGGAHGHPLRLWEVGSAQAGEDLIVWGKLRR
jgi:riboflavin-specific deaminase-like protein